MEDDAGRNAREEESPRDDGAGGEREGERRRETEHEKVRRRKGKGRGRAWNSAGPRIGPGARVDERYVGQERVVQVRSCGWWCNSRLCIS